MAEAFKMTPLIETKALCKTFTLDSGSTIEALDGVDIQIFDKEFVCLLGPSGCGKSTWLRIIAGLEKTTSGEALFKGEAITAPSKERGMDLFNIATTNRVWLCRIQPDEHYRSDWRICSHLARARIATAFSRRRTIHQRC